MVDHYPKGLNTYIIKGAVAKHIRDFLGKIGINIDISPDDIEIQGILAGTAGRYDPKTNKLYLNDSVLELTKAKNLDELLSIIKRSSYTIEHEAIHLGMGREHGDMDMIDKTGLKEFRGIYGVFSEGIAYLLTMYRALERGYIGIVQPLIYKLEKIIKKELYSSKTAWTYEEEIEVDRKAREMALNIIRQKGPRLLVDDRYREAVIETLQQLIYDSLIVSYPASDRKELDEIVLNRIALSYCMAKVAIDMFNENFKKYGDLNIALYKTLSISNYPTYRERVIKEFPKCRDLFTFDEKGMFIVKKE